MTLGLSGSRNAHSLAGLRIFRSINCNWICRGLVREETVETIRSFTVKSSTVHRSTIVGCQSRTGEALLNNIRAAHASIKVVALFAPTQR